MTRETFGTPSQRLLNMAAFVVDGQEPCQLHRSVLDRVAEIAERLDCHAAGTLGTLPASFSGAGLARLRWDLAQINAFADAALRTGWVFGDLAVAPGELPVPLMNTSDGRLWVHSARGLELRPTAGGQRVTELTRLSELARQTALTDLIAPLADAATHARSLRVYQREP